jgi:lysophospholipase L1-like esterase
MATHARHDGAAVGDSRPARRKATLGARLLLATGTLLLTLVPLEWMARRHFAERDLRLADARAVPADRELELLDLVAPSKHRDLVYELKPSLAGSFQGVPYRSNAHGMRDAELAAEPPAGGYRVALLGDSFSFAWGVDVGDGFADLLEPMISEALGGRAVEVLNFGVPGYNTATEAACLEHKALPLRPDLVVVQYFYNDAYLPNFVLDAPRRSALRLVDWVAERLRPATATPSLVMPGGSDGEARESPVAAWRADPRRVPPDLAYMVGPAGLERALRRIKTATDAAGVPLFLFMVTYPGPKTLADPTVDVAMQGFDAEVVHLCDEIGIPYVATLDRIVDRQRARGESMHSIIRSPSDWHPNADGHRLFAQVLRDGLEQAGLIASGH